jgi:hypothetical protein
MLPLADSERQEISAAFDEARAKAEEAGEAMERLLAVLKKKSAFISNGRINEIRSSQAALGSATFMLSVQRCSMLPFGAARALK